MERIYLNADYLNGCIALYSERYAWPQILQNLKMENYFLIFMCNNLSPSAGCWGRESRGGECCCETKQDKIYTGLNPDLHQACKNTYLVIT